MRRQNLLLFLFGALVLSCNNANVGGNGQDPDDLTGLSAIRVEPPDLTLESSATQVATYGYKAIGTFPDGERDLSSRVTFYLDNSGVGQFNQAQFQGSNRQGGDTKVYAQVGGITGSAHLLVHFSATVKIAPGAGGGAALPADPSLSFKGTAVATRSPQLVYPNNGVMLPPNIQSLEVHWKPGQAANTLFQLSFQSPSTNVTTYTRCGTPVNNGCIFALDADTYSYVANSNSGGQPVSLTVRGSDDNATGFGESATFQMQFSQENVNGGLYYWTTSGNTGIMRVDFGSSSLTPTLFLTPNQNGLPGTCVGCHAISRDGTKMVSSLGGQNDGRLVYIANMAAAPANLVTLNGTTAASSNNHVQFASFNPDGSRFVAIYGDAPAPERNTLFMHDGNTGLRISGESVVLTFEPDHPDWSPNGGMIAFSHVGQHQTSQRPFNCGIDMVQQTGTAWGQPTTVVPITPGKNRYNPNFAPDSSFFIYSESTCATGSTGDDCDADADPSAKTWAVKPQAGATAVALAKASAGGVMDTQTALSDTYPRFSPFQQKQGAGRLFWVTVSSRRKAGLRDPGAYNGGKQWLWMFAVDPDKVAAGQDGSYPGFFLPFQDLSTSNHIGQWTQRVVTGPG